MTAHQNVNGNKITLLAGADLSTHQFKQMKLDATLRQVVLCGDGEPSIGVLLNAPDAAGKDAEIATPWPIFQGLAGGTIAAVADELACDATGRLVAGTSAEVVIGYSLETAAVGERISYLAMPKSGAVA